MRAVDWDRIGKIVDEVYSAPEGRPSYPPLMMVKVMLLQQWYNASDPEMEAALWGQAFVPTVRGTWAAGRLSGLFDH